MSTANGLPREQLLAFLGEMLDPRLYRDNDELRKLQETRDPIESLRAQLALSEEEWAGLDAEAQGVVDGALESALAGTDPDPSDALKYVYAEAR